MIEIAVLLAVFLLISLRQAQYLRVEIWQIMVAGALAVILTGRISPYNAFKAIDFDVIVFLFGMFVCSALFEISGYLEYNQRRIFKKAVSSQQALFLFIFVCAFFSALVMNDTMAIIGVPVALNISSRFKISAKPMLLALAFSVTIGSVFSPIGNPQNLIIAMRSGMSNPFISFLKYLFLPTVLNLFILFLMLRLFYKNEFSVSAENISYLPKKKKWLYFLSNLTMAIMLLTIIAKIYLSFQGKELSLIWIAVLSSIPALLLSFRQIEILKRTDFKTLIFFAAMFILMRSVWDSGLFQNVLEYGKEYMLSMPFIFLSGVVISQFISNVPLVALLLPILLKIEAQESHLLSLAASSTIAGNLSILGAASNVIVIQNAENRGEETITFWEFFRIGAPLTLINCFLYWLFLR